jgi:hypothetical protein
MSGREPVANARRLSQLLTQSVRVFPLVATLWNLAWHRILVAVLVTGMIYLLGEASLNQEVEHLAKLRFVATEAMQQTKSHIAAASWQIARDESLFGHLREGNLNTLGQTLQNYLQPGVISQIEILTKDCGVVVRVPQSAKPIPSGCRNDLADKAKMEWNLNRGEEPVLSHFTLKNAGTERYWVVVHVLLDGAWSSSIPQLFSAMTKGRMVMERRGSSRGLLWKDGHTAGNDYVVQFYRGGWVGRFFPNLMQFDLGTHLDFKWWFLGMILIISVLSSLKYSYQNAEVENSFKEGVTLFQVALRRSHLQSDREYEHLKPGSEGALGVPEGQMAQFFLRLIRSYMSLIDKIIASKEAQLKLMRERQDKQSLLVMDRDRHLAELNEKLASMSDLASLKEQLQHSSGAFLTLMEEIRSRIETMFDVSADGLAKSSQSLQNFAKRWKAGISDEYHRERGARKFFRAMSETPGQRAGKSQLDDELEDLMQSSTVALNESLHIAMMSRQILADVESGVRIAAIWHGLAMRDQDRDLVVDWVECLGNAQKMIAADAKYASLVFEHLPSVIDAGSLYIPVARVALVSGLFHLYMALLSDIDVSEIQHPIVVRQKRIADQGSIILSLPQSAADIADSAPGRSQSFHFELSKAILGPFGIKVAFLPPTIAGVPIAMMWKLPHTEYDIAASAKWTQKSPEPEVELHR